MSQKTIIIIIVHSNTTMADNMEKSAPPHVEEQRLPSADEKPIEEQMPNETAQDGVKIAEAMTLSWNKSSLIAVFIW